MLTNECVSLHLTRIRNSAFIAIVGDGALRTIPAIASFKTYKK